MGQSRSRPKERRGWRERAPAPRDHQRVIASTKHRRAPHQPQRGRAAKASARTCLEAWRGDNRQSPYSIGDNQAPRAQHLPEGGAQQGHQPVIWIWKPGPSDLIGIRRGRYPEPTRSGRKPSTTTRVSWGMFCSATASMRAKAQRAGGRKRKFGPPCQRRGGHKFF